MIDLLDVKLIIRDDTGWMNNVKTTMNEMFKLALANASRHVLLRSKVLEEVVCFYNVMLRKYFALPVNE